MRVALLGGSFNPPHIGHLMAAVYVHECLGDDRVWLMPTFHHPFGKQTLAFEHRVAMCRAMAKPYDWLEVRTDEQDVGGEGRTIDLLRHLIPQHPKVRFRLVIGSDIVADLPKWKAWAEIQRLVDVTVLNRAGYPAKGAIGPPLAEVSSTVIRGRLDPALVPGTVLAYLKKRKLFR